MNLVEVEALDVGDRVATVNPESHRFNHPEGGIIVEIVEKPVWEEVKVGDRKERRCVFGDPENAGESFAWVKYPDGIRTPHDLSSLRLVGEG